MSYTNCHNTESSRAARKNGQLMSLIQEEREKGVDYSTFEEQPASLEKLCSPYEKSLPEVIRKACQAAGVNNETRFLDVGCGKGFCLSLVYREFKPEQIAGVEINSQWADIAKKNLEKEGLNIPVYTCDILNFELLSAYNYYYLFNPFGVEIMTNFLKKLKSTLISKPREITILYNNPTCHQNVMKYANSFTYVQHRHDELVHCVSIYKILPQL